MFDILKDFAMVDRREYLPSCPVCGFIFSDSSELRLLDCKHFFCARCVEYFLNATAYHCPFCSVVSPQVQNGGVLGEAVAFLANWIQTAQNPSQKEYVIDRLLDEIVMLRKNLKFEGVPCRIQAKNECVKNFACPYDHTMTHYRKKACPRAKACQNEQCMFLHLATEETKDAKKAMEVSSRKEPSAKKGGTNTQHCCELS